MYREPGKTDQYIIDQRPIIKREIHLPKINTPVWFPGAVCFVFSPVLCGLAWTFLSGGICAGVFTSFIFLGIAGVVHAAAAALKD